MPVITISRESGSLGTEVAEKVAASLGYHLVDKDTIELIFTKYGYGGRDLVELEKASDPSTGFWARFADRIQQRQEALDILDQVTLALARHGNMVILGRGGFVVLGGFADVLNVLIKAPLSMRVQRITSERSVTDRDEAEELVRQNDQTRAAFLRSAYDVSCESAEHFDLVVDTGKVPLDSAVKMLVAAVAALNVDSGEGRPVTEGIQVERALASAVSDALGCRTSRH